MLFVLGTCTLAAYYAAKWLWESISVFSFPEKKQLKNTEIPLLERILQGPSEKIAQFFLMDRDAEEVSSDVRTV